MSGTRPRNDEGDPFQRELDKIERKFEKLELENKALRIQVNDFDELNEITDTSVKDQYLKLCENIEAYVTKCKNCETAGPFRERFLGELKEKPEHNSLIGLGLCKEGTLDTATESRLGWLKYKPYCRRLVVSRVIWTNLYEILDSKWPLAISQSDVEVFENIYNQMRSMGSNTEVAHKRANMWKAMTMKTLMETAKFKTDLTACQKSIAHDLDEDLPYWFDEQALSKAHHKSERRYLIEQAIKLNTSISCSPSQLYYFKSLPAFQVGNLTEAPKSLTFKSIETWSPPTDDAATWVLPLFPGLYGEGLDEALVQPVMVACNIEIA